MLAYLTRTVPLVLRARFGRDGRLVSRLQRRVKLSQVDFNLHMNQAVYAQVTELSRTDWVLRSGAWDRWRSHDVNPVVAEQTLVYRRELRPLQRYTLDTRAVAVEGRLLRTETWLLVGDRVHAKVVAKLIFVGPAGVLAADEAEGLCEGLTTAPLPVEDWTVVG